MSTELVNSPTIRRSNSYRIALRKSGVPSEVIEELNARFCPQPNTNTPIDSQPITKDLPRSEPENDGPKERLFVKHRQQMTTSRFKYNMISNSNPNTKVTPTTDNHISKSTNNDDDEDEILLTLKQLSVNSDDDNDNDQMVETLVSNGHSKHVINVDDDDHNSNSNVNQSDWIEQLKHLFCRFCCCNYCCNQLHDHC